MKKRLFPAIVLIGLFALVVSPVTTSFAEENPQGPTIPEGWVSVFLPFVRSGAGGSFTVSGQVKDAQDFPLSEVTITAANGATSTTDELGLYSITVPAGNQEIVAAKEDYKFEPAVAQLDVDKNMDNLHFTGIEALMQVIPNPGFETVDNYWNPISSNANGYTPYFSSEQSATPPPLGYYSGFTGIRPSPMWENKESWSRWRSHEITIPEDALFADFFFSIWTQTTNVADPHDFHYMALIDPDTNNLYRYLYGPVLTNNQAWIPIGPFDLVALGWAGQTFKLEFGTYNNGYGGKASAYFDDVYLFVDSPSFPPLAGCASALVNSDFEIPVQGVGWDWYPLQTVPPSWSTWYTEPWIGNFFNMVAGPPGGINAPQNIWTTSEFFQTATMEIPEDAWAARLSMRLLPKSDELNGYAPSPLEFVDEVGNPEAIARAESQYGHIRNETGVITKRVLFNWFHIDSAYWLYREFDLLEFRGETISVLFGAMNDGDLWEDTRLWVDDVYLDVCR